MKAVVPMSLLRLAVSFSLLAVVAAQQAPFAGPAAFDPGAAIGASRDGDDVVGIGPRYLLRAAADAVCYTPVLGNEASRALPLGLRFVGASSGGEPVATTAAVRSHAGRTIEFARGTVRERYELRADGVEQTFTFASRPAGAGDLVVRLAATSVVRGVATPSGGLSFREHGRGVDYGALLGIDARGRTTAGTVRLVGDEIWLALPGDFVATAAFPLTFDPLIGTAALANSATDDGDPAVGVGAFGLNSRSLIAWRRVVALGESHLVAQFVDTTPAAGTPFLVDSTAGGDVATPCVAMCQSMNCFVIAWRSRLGLFGAFAVKARLVPNNGGSLTPTLQVATAVRSLALGNASLTSPLVPLVLVADTGAVSAQALLVTSQPAITVGGANSLGTANPNDGEVAISRHPSNSRHLVVWNNGVITGRVIEASGMPVGPAATVATGGLRFRPSVDGAGSDFLVTSHTSTAVTVQPCVLTTTGLVTNVATNGTATTVASGAAGTVGNGDVVHAGGKFVASWQTLADPFDTAAKCVVLAPNGQLIGPVFDLVGPVRAGGYTRQGAPRLAARGAGALDDVVMAVLEEGQAAPPFDRDVVVQFVETMGAGGAITSVAPGCGFGGVCATNGPCALGNADFAFTMANGDPTALSTLLSLAVPTPFFPCGGCTLLPPLVLEQHPLVGGAATRAFPIPGDATLLGAQIVAQWLPVFGAAGPCPLFPLLTASNILEVTVGL